jgi:dephospho-CoA kinase
MKKIALTGGIGVGKTTVAKEFEKLGVPVFYSDDEAKKIYENPDVQAQINSILPEPVFNSAGQLDKEKYRNYIFKNEEIRKQVNAIVHPMVRRKFEEFCHQHSGSSYVINEAALHIETGGWRLFDKVILVTAPLELRIERLKKRDGLNEEEIKRRIDAQMQESEKLKFADFVFVNDEKKQIRDFALNFHNQVVK